MLLVGLFRPFYQFIFGVSEQNSILGHDNFYTLTKTEPFSMLLRDYYPARRIYFLNNAHLILHTESFVFIFCLKIEVNDSHKMSKLRV